MSRGAFATDLPAGEWSSSIKRNKAICPHLRVDGQQWTLMQVKQLYQTVMLTDGRTYLCAEYRAEHDATWVTDVCMTVYGNQCPYRPGQTEAAAVDVRPRWQPLLVVGTRGRRS